MRRLCIFAHYDPDNEVKPYILFLLRSIRQECDEISFVSTSSLPQAEQDKARSTCSSVVCKENTGYDFGMWKYAIERTDLSAWDELALVNSSILGPLAPLHPIMRRMELEDCDFWGMTDNTEIEWHLQSYFLVFKSPVLRSPAFRQFWDAVLPYRNKKQVIRSYEVGLTVFLREQGFRGRAFVEMASLRPVDFITFVSPRRKRNNPTCTRPVELVAKGFPFVKLELLRDNPEGIFLWPIRRMMVRSGYDMSLIPPGLVSERLRRDASRTIRVP